MFFRLSDRRFGGSRSRDLHIFTTEIERPNACSQTVTGPSSHSERPVTASVPRAPEFLTFENSFSQIALELFAPGTVRGTLQRIVDLAARSIDGCDAAGVFFILDSKAVTVAASHPLVHELDHLQIAADEGPCVDASTKGLTIYAGDLTDDDRWPTFGPRALDAGIRCVLAYSLSATRPSALNLYARLPAAFGATGRAQGQLFATLAGIALDSAEARAAHDERVANLTEALRTRELIGQAQGILMERERITADQAFGVLRRASQHMNIKLREVAEALVETGESPWTPTPPATERNSPDGP